MFALVFQDKDKELVLIFTGKSHPMDRHILLVV